jgi:hypothetical protein
MTDGFWIHVGFGTGVAGTVTARGVSLVLATIVGEGVAGGTLAEGSTAAGVSGAAVGDPAGACGDVHPAQQVTPMMRIALMKRSPCAFIDLGFIHNTLKVIIPPGIVMVQALVSEKKIFRHE